MTNTSQVEPAPGALRPRSLWNKYFILLNIISILINTGFSMVTTTVSLYAVNIGVSLAMAGTIVSVFSLAALFTRPFGGWVMDSFNKKWVFMLSTVLFGLIVVGYGIAKDTPSLLILRIMHGIAFSVSGTATMALASLYIPRKRMGEGLGYLSTGFLIGQAVGPTLAISIRDAYGYQLMYMLVAGLITIPPLLFLWAKVPKTAPAVKHDDHPKKRMWDKLIIKKAIVYAIICGLFSFYNGEINSFIVLIGEERAIQSVSLFFTVSSVTLLLVRAFFGKLSDRISLSWVVNVSLVFSLVSMLITGSAISLLPMLAAAVLKALGQGVGQVALQAQAIKSADASKVGAATSTMYIGSDLGNTLGPLVGGLLSKQYGYQVMMYSSVAITLVSILVFNLYQHSKAKQK